MRPRSCLPEERGTLLCYYREHVEVLRAVCQGERERRKAKGTEEKGHSRWQREWKGRARRTGLPPYHDLPTFPSSSG